jgi:hypothetical protein
MIVEFPNSKSKSYFIETQAPNDGFLVLQWYNSGIFVKFGNKIVGFDILPGFFRWVMIVLLISLILL